MSGTILGQYLSVPVNGSWAGSDTYSPNIRTEYKFNYPQYIYSMYEWRYKTIWDTYNLIQIPVLF